MIGVAGEPRRETELLYSHGSFLAEEDMTFEVVEFIELAFQPGRSMPPPSEVIVGTYDGEDEAVDAARDARDLFMQENGIPSRCMVARPSAGISTRHLDRRRLLRTRVRPRRPHRPAGRDLESPASLCANVLPCSMNCWRLTG